jgi:hypothetical protein
MTKLYVFALSLLFLAPRAQNLDKTFYLLGTLQDYLGRPDYQSNPRRWGEICILHKDHAGQIERIQEITKIKFKHWHGRHCSNCHEFVCLKSLRISRKLEHFYKKDPQPFYKGGKILNAAFIDKTSKNQKISFISGQFLTSGSKDSVYRISLYNSYERFQIVKRLLVELNVNIISESETAHIPFGNHIVFYPDDELKAYLDKEFVYKLKDKSLY